MSRHLLTWSDRGVRGRRPDHHGARPVTDRGPVMRLLTSRPAGCYQRATVLCSQDGLEPARELERDMRAHVPEVESRVLELRDPSDYGLLFARLGPVIDALSAHARAPGAMPLDVLLSAGTPQMQTLWVILVESGLLQATMLQVIPAAFVPSIHPQPVRDVHLDIDGFPEIRALRAEVVRLRAQSRILGVHLVGDSRPMRELAEKLARVAATELPVLIHGETGTGKELVARSLHHESARAAGPLITENCGALSESVLASELFGHEKGAFTGAVAQKRGLFELAHGGTLLLDEVGELTPRMQANLLRVLQDGSLRRVGGERAIRVDVRVLAATHRDLAAMVREGSFREDLYYRLRGATVTVPPLRRRLDDLELLIEHFMREAGGLELAITRAAWRALRRYSWPGNVRELRAEVMRWRVFCEGRVTLDDLSPEIAAADGQSDVGAPQGVRIDGRSTSDAQSGVLEPLGDVVARAERAAIENALALLDHNLSRVARRLQIDRNTLKRKIRRLGIQHRSRPAGRPTEW